MVAPSAAVYASRRGALCHLPDTAKPDLCDAGPNTGISLPERT